MVGQDHHRAKSKKLSFVINTATATLTRITNSSTTKAFEEQASIVEKIKEKASSMHAFVALLMAPTPDIDDYVNLLDHVMSYSGLTVGRAHEDYAVSLVAKQCMTHRDVEGLSTIFAGTHKSLPSYFIVGGLGAESPLSEEEIAQAKGRLIQTVWLECLLEATSKLQCADAACRAPTANKSFLIDIHTMCNGLSRTFVNRRELMELKVLVAFLDPFNVPVTDLNEALEAQASGHVKGCDSTCESTFLDRLDNDDVNGASYGGTGPILRFVMESTAGLRFTAEAKAVAQGRQGEVRCEQCFEEYKGEVAKVVAGGGFYFLHGDSTTITIRADAFDSPPFADLIEKEKELQEWVLALTSKKKRGFVLDEVKEQERKVWSTMAGSFDAMSFQNLFDCITEVLSALEKE